jgi:tetratricopeptide (TPR) repeat protein
MRVGDCIDGRYVLESVAGEGGMGTVYRARDTTSGKFVALKVIGRIAAQPPSPTSRARFAREIRVLSQLSHPNVVRYLQDGLTADGRPYFAMEWLEGEALSSRLARGAMAVPEGLRLFRRIAEALACAHAAGIVHRDIKPSNILLLNGAVDRTKLIDFGLARVGGAGTTTATGQVLGTPEYMAPEQARGSAVVDARADVFALGCVVFRALSGRRPFEGEEPLAILSRIVFGETPRLRSFVPDSPESLDHLLARMLSKSPDARPADGAALVRELDALVSSSGTAPLRLDGLSSTEARFVNVVAVAPRLAPPAGPEEATRPVLDASDVRQRLAEVVLRHGARIECLIDGSMVAVLRLEGAFTDRAAIAARCALELRGMLPDGAIALTTGRAEVTGREALGEALDRAASLCAQGGDSDSSAVRIDEATASLIAGRFEVTSDRRSPVLVGERPTAERLRVLLGRPTPFVGRERERAALLGSFEDCVRERRPVGALVTGPAGCGKSRLRDEVSRGLLEVAPRTVIWHAQGDPIAGRSPLAILRELLACAGGYRTGDAPAAKRAALRTLVTATVPVDDRARVLAFLAEAASVPLDANDATNPHTSLGKSALALVGAAREDAVLMADQMRAAWVDLVSAVAVDRPVVLVLEDLQWGDEPSVRFVDALFREVEGRGVFLLAVARPEVHEVFPKLRDRRNVQELHLAPLPLGASRTLATHLLGPQASRAVVDRIVELCFGNAFFLEELIRSAATGRLDSFPDTVLAMLEARLERIRADDRRALRAASVFGRSFWAGGVAGLLGEPERQVKESLDRLIEAELVRPRRESTFRGEREYAFVHELIRESAYGSLTRDDRTTGHRLCARWLRRQGETSPLLLAEHFERGAQLGDAASCYLQAARQANDANDFAGVLSATERGLRCRCSDAERGAMFLLRAEVLRWQGDLAGCLQASNEALKWIDPQDDTWYVAASEVVFASARTGRDVEVARTCAELLERSSRQRVGHAHLAAVSRTIPELVYAGYGSIADAFETLLDQSISRGPTPPPAVRARVHSARGLRALARGDVGAHYDHMLAAVAYFEEVRDVRAAYAHLGSVGFALLEFGQYERAERALRRVADESHRLGLRAVGATARCNLALAVARQGRFDEARASINSALDALSTYGNARLQVAFRIVRARVAGWSGDATSAEAEASSALGGGAPSAVRAYAHAVRADALLALGRTGEAADNAAAAVELSRKLGGIEEGETLAWWVHARAQRMLRTPRAREIAVDARRLLLERAGTIRDETLRASFLRIPEHEALLAGV